MRVHSQGAKEARAGLRSRCLRLAACRFLRSELILQPLLPAAAADLLSRYEPEHKYRQATCQRSLRPTDGTVPRVRLPDLHSDRSIAVADRPHVPTCACVWCLRFDGMRTRAFVSVPTCTYGCVPSSPSLPALACIGAVLSGVAQLYQRRARQPAHPALAVFPLCARCMASTLG